MKRYLLKNIIFCLGFLFILPEITQARQINYTSQNLRDPFQNPFEMHLITKEQPERPVESIGYDLPHLSVQGIVWGTQMPQAIINNTIVKIGESIAEAEVLDIRKEGVYLLYQGKQYILRPMILKPRRGR
jgi:hypothetical protein